MICQKINVLLIAIMLLFMKALDSRRRCSMTESYADACGKKLLFVGEHSTRWPTTDSEMLKACHTIEDGLRCMKRYAKSCLDPFATQMMNLLVRSAQRTERRYCRNEEKRKELLSHFLCTEETDERLTQMHLCMDKFIVQMEHLANVTGDFRLPATCCSYLTMDKCVIDKYRLMCNKPDSVKFLNKFLTEMTGDIMQTGCGKFDSIANCEANMDTKEWNKLKSLVASDDPKVINAMRINESPFIAIKNVFKELVAE